MRESVIINSRSLSLIRQFAKYATVAIIGLFLHLGLLTALVELVHIHYTISFIAALPLTYVTKFALDKQWTFRQADSITEKGTDK